MRNKLVLTCPQRFFSQKDEDAFFNWIKQIPAIREYKGVYNQLDLFMKSKRISNRDLRELIALFYRYNIDMKQLKVFLNKENKNWFFENKIAFWHDRVFGTEENSQFQQSL